MQNLVNPEFIISGVGVLTPIGVGRTQFADGLISGRSSFGVMRRSGRQRGTEFLGAELPDLACPKVLPEKLWRSATLSAQAALVALCEAWQDANLAAVDSQRIGLVVGGSNFQQRQIVQLQDAYRERFDFVRPNYALNFMDTDLCGVCTEGLNIRGLAYTIGGASASGHLAIIQALQAVQTGQVDVCIAVGALMDLSYWELQALRFSGAMGSDRFAKNPSLACRPFDSERDGFIFSECCAAVVVERADGIKRENVNPYAAFRAWATAFDGNRNPDPSLDGEIAALQRVLADGGLTPRDIDYVNPHGSGSIVGDAIELDAIRACGLDHAYINTTKSLTGHGLSAAGATEIVATVLQMRAGMLHPSRNLSQPIDPTLNWVGENAVPHPINRAVNISLGFGGINTAICLQRCSSKNEQ
ncbi:malonyl-ACP decarboxylase [Bradyrhizobium sp. USDA 4524]|uniref:beta-ketoacyl synthase N-terminal-like domain-containing protein n=1 Tax=unclassified Bradyrhizobium TaxID=2631580 RepID=UPI0020A210E3|nr:MULTISPECIES: beta-ketoacyl synthase N-terminal-like domain-containing protein [unclassified Bradyrhizobium]MCP1846018.1 malonyl-ACP decarboxylase [Bradyrhizobium sp. USDA 4538]MCP1907348.1 malonyl-ACP decarboxylase [Bradyrhizobium sp. USDA 4537]MCP1985134.1 malonyl-ACP decarboxylase [Bradyrhizobium sp. USDA 4539]